MPDHSAESESISLAEQTELYTDLCDLIDKHAKVLDRYEQKRLFELLESAHKSIIRDFKRDFDADL